RQGEHMTAKCNVVLCALLLTVVPVVLFAATGDREGSQDHPLLKRYEGAIIIRYDHKEFDEYTVPLGKVVSKPDGSGYVFSKSTHLEGDVTRLIYLIPEGRSTLEVMRNYEKDLKSRGFTSPYAASGKEAEWIQSVDHEVFPRIAGNTNQYRAGTWK